VLHFLSAVPTLPLAKGSKARSWLTLSLPFPLGQMSDANPEYGLETQDAPFWGQWCLWFARLETDRSNPVLACRQLLGQVHLCQLPAVMSADERAAAAHHLPRVRPSRSL
jgi:hypothetical protein